MLDEILCGSDEIIKYILFFLLDPLLVPGLTVFTTASYIGNCIDPAIFQQNQVGGLEIRRETNRKSSISIE